MPTEITPPRISSKDMAPSQPIAGVKVETTRGKEAETQGQEHRVEHHPPPWDRPSCREEQLTPEETRRDFRYSHHTARRADVAVIAKNRQIDV
jgi:hypothetical protein